MNEKSLVPLKEKIESIAVAVGSFSIKSNDDLKMATAMLSEMNKYADKVKEKKEEITKPINNALKSARALFKPVEEVYENAISSLRLKMTVYQTEQVRIRKEEEEKIAKKLIEGKIKINTAVKKIENLSEVEKEVATDSGLVQFREVKRFEVIDIKELPIEYHMANEQMITKAMKDNIEIKGVRYFVEQVPVNYR
jgi:hypothetical protein